MTGEKRCKRCLLNELDEAEQYKNIYEYIDSIPEERKTGAEEYGARLTVCRSCDRLVNGICAACGCFVEVRAVIEKNYCPDVKKQW